MAAKGGKVTFRILTNGTEFRAQVKVFWWWSYLKKFWCVYTCGGYSPIKFESDADAVAHIRKEYGESARILRPWRVSLAAEAKELGKSTPNTAKPKSSGGKARGRSRTSAVA